MLRYWIILIFSPMLFSCSKEISAPTGPAAKATASPLKPTNPRIENLTSTSVQLAWDAVEGATDYDINYKKRQGGRWTNWPHRGARRLHTTIDSLESNTEYRWAVRAENRDGPSEWAFGENFETLHEEISLESISDIEKEYDRIMSPGFVGVALSHGRPQKVTFLDGLPLGLEYDSPQNRIFGIPLKEGTYILREFIDGGEVQRTLLIIFREKVADTYEIKQIGHSYLSSYSLKAISDGPAPFTARLEGTLPSGFSFKYNEKYATIWGSPEHKGIFDVTVLVTDADGQEARKSIRYIVLNKRT